MKRKCENLVDLPWKRPKLPVLSVDRRVRATHAPIFNLTSRYVSGKDSGPLFTIPRLGYFRRFSISNFRRLLPSRTSSTSFLRQLAICWRARPTKSIWDKVSRSCAVLAIGIDSTFPSFRAVVRDTICERRVDRKIETRITRFLRRYKTASDEHLSRKIRVF